MEDFPNSTKEFNVGQRVHASGDSTRIGTVKYVGNVEGYSDTWVGIDWDYGGGKHDGSINDVRYFHAKSEKSGSFVRPKNLCKGIEVTLEKSYRSNSTKDEEGRFISHFNSFYILF
jgi:dynactin complex subunit